jgi:hypothetical protein
MLVDEIADPDALTPADLRAEYEAAIVAVVEAVGVETAAAETDVSRETLDALLDGAQPPLSIEEATQLLALDPETPDAETLLLGIRDSVMLGMSTAVMDVDAMEAGLPIEMEARDIQQKIEGRQRMTLAEYAEFAHYIASENPY